MRLVFTPVFIMVLGIGLLALLALYRRDRIVALVASVLFCFAYLCSTAAPVGVVLRLWQVPRAAECGQPQPGGTYVVLTGGASGAARRSDDVTLLQQASFRRLVYAVDLASLAPDSRLLISGGAEVGLVNEAQIARAFVLRLGWPADRLTIEERSTDTFTSAQEVSRVIQSQDISGPLTLVTSAMHMRRAQFAYRHAGVAALACPTDYVDLFPIFPDSLLPDAGALQKASEGWKEVAGMAVYALRAALARPGESS